MTKNHETDIIMYPFEVNFTRTIEKPYDPNKVKYLLVTAKKLIAMYRIEDFKLKDNRLDFRNKFWRLRVILGMMDEVDSGLVEVFETENHAIGVRYTVSLTYFWVKMIIVTLVVLFISPDRTMGMLACILIGGIGWGYLVLRHRWFLKVITKWMVKPPEKKETTRPTSLYSSMVIEDEEAF